MKSVSTLLAVLTVAGLLAPALAQEITPYSVQEIDQFMKVFKQTYKNKKQPEDDAVAVLEDLKKAHKYIVSKETKGEATKEELSAKKKIVKLVASGLKVRNRPLVTLECARALGAMGDKAGAKPLLAWMDRTVLDAKSPNPQWVEYGFLSLAWIGGEDKAALDLVTKYASGRHLDIGVATQALRAAYEWRELSGKNRKELFEKISGYLGGLWSEKTGGEPKRRGAAEKKYNTVKDEGLRALSELAGVDKPFAEPPKALEWWRENKKQKWEPYVGVKFRVKKKTPPAKPEDEAKG